jgi:hypothetical protein
MTRSLAIFFTVLFLVFQSPGAVAAGFSNKWRLEVSEGANSEGVIQLRITTKKGEIFNVDAEIPDGTSENHVARIIRNSLRDKLPSKRFHIEVDDGEDVLIKKRHRGKNFQLEVTGNNVKGVRLHLQKE